MKISILSMFCFVFLHSYGQRYCEKTTVYFDFSKSELTEKSLKTLDSLASVLSGKTYLLELYAFTDSTASFAYNEKLSQQRNESVRKHLLSKSTKETLKFIEKHFGESENGSNANDPALYRRVDIYLIPIKNGQLYFSEQNEQVSLPIDYFEPCGICASKPKLKGIYTNDEADSEHMVFESTEGEPLETAGTMKLEMEPCNERKENNLINYFVSASEYDPEMTLWDADTINGIVYWKDTGIKPDWDPVTKQYRFSSAYGWINIDKKKIKYSIEIIFPEEIKPIKSRIDDLREKSIITEKDSIGTGGRIAKFTSVKSYGTVQNSIFYLNQNLNTFIESVDTSSCSRFICIRMKCRVPLSAYTEVSSSDTLVKFKYKKGSNMETLGLFIPEVENYVPFVENLPKKSLVISKPLTENKVAFVRNNKIYVADLNRLEGKYNKRKKTVKIKLNSHNLTKFSFYDDTSEEEMIRL